MRCKNENELWRILLLALGLVAGTYLHPHRTQMGNLLLTRMRIGNRELSIVQIVRVGSEASKNDWRLERTNRRTPWQSPLQAAKRG